MSGTERVGDAIERVVFADQFPAGADLAQAARDSLIRYAHHFGLRYDPMKTRTQWGTRWRPCWCRDDGLPPGEHLRQVFPMVNAVRISATVIGHGDRPPAGEGGCPPGPLSSAEVRHWRTTPTRKRDHRARRP